MGTSFREMPWYLQVLIFFGLAVVIVAAGEWLPISPVKTAREQLVTLNQQEQTLTQQVNSLEVYRRRFSEFRAETDAMQKQLETLKAIVPADKDLDEFLRMVQGAAASSGIEIRKMVSGNIVPRDYHYEMPFSVELDGPYYGVLDFFGRLSRLSRVINVGDVAFTGLSSTEKTKVPERPGTTVKASLTLVTFFTNNDDGAPASGKPNPAQAKH
jgi:Tfp pilus assembly protein PilO